MQGLWFPTALGPPLGTTPQPNPDHPQAAGLVAWWPPIGAGGGLLYDHAAFDHGTLTNSPAWATGPEGGIVLRLVGGSAQYVAMAATNTRLQPGTGTWSVVSWFRTATTATGTARSTYVFQSTGNYLVQMVMLTGGNFQFSLRDGPAQTCLPNSGTTLINDTLWHCAVGVRTSQTTAEIYLDGLSCGQASNGSLGTILPATTHSLGTFDTALQFWDGDLGETRVYNRALSPAEIWQLWDPATRWELYAAPRRLSQVADTLSPPGATFGPVTRSLSYQPQ